MSTSVANAFNVLAQILSTIDEASIELSELIYRNGIELSNEALRAEAVASHVPSLGVVVLQAQALPQPTSFDPSPVQGSADWLYW